MGLLDRLRTPSAAQLLAGSVATLAARARPLELSAPQVLERAQQVVPDRDSRWGAQLAVIAGGFSTPRKGSREMLEAYAQLPWLHALVRRRAEALAAVCWTLHRRTGGDARSSRARADVRALLERKRGGCPRAARELEAHGALEPLDTHPLLSLLGRPNPVLTGRSVFEVSSKHFDLVGETFWGVERDGAGRPIELWPIVPTWVRTLPSPQHPYWEIDSGYFDVVARGPKRLIPAVDVFWMREHDPFDPYRRRGVGVARSVDDELQTDEYAASMAKTRFLNRATPETIISLPLAGQDAVEKFSAEFESKHRGAERVGQTHVLNQDFKVQQIAHSMVESQYVECRKLLRDFIMQNFGMPPEMLGVLENANRSTIDAAETFFLRHGVVPQLERFRSELQAWLVPEFGEDLELGFVSPVPADLEFRKAVMVALPAAFTRDEVRELAGVEPADERGGEFYGATPGATAAANVPAPGQVDEQQLPPAVATDDVDLAVPSVEGAGVETVQDTALNGAQVESLVGILEKVASGVLSEQTAKALIAAAFPGIAADQIAEMLAGMDDVAPPLPAPPQPPPAEPPSPAPAE